MVDFNPDVYIADKTASQNGGGFDPDQYITEKSPPYSPETPNEPGLQDVTIPDAMMVQGVGGLAKAGAGLAARGVGAGLEALPLTKNIVPTTEDMSNDLLLRSLGTRSGQVKNLANSAVPGSGLQAARDAANLGRQAGVGDIFSTQRGRLESLGNLIEQHGKEIGQLRQEAGAANPNIYEQVAQDVSQKYNPANADLLSPQAAKINKAVNLVKNTAAEEQPTHAGIAKGLTELNDYIRGESLRRPTGAMADVAQKLGAKNNAQIAQSLGSDKAKAYVDALQNESGAFHLKPLMERGAERQSVGVQGTGGPLSLLHRGINNVIYRTGSKGLDALHSTLANTPDLTNVPPAIAKTLLSYLAEKEDKNAQ
jgi:hypothetical protein